MKKKEMAKKMYKMHGEGHGELSDQHGMNSGAGKGEKPTQHGKSTGYGKGEKPDMNNKEKLGGSDFYKQNGSGSGKAGGMGYDMGTAKKEKNY